MLQMKTKINVIIISVVVSAIVAILVYSFVPLSVLEYFSSDTTSSDITRNLGTSITTINGTDRITDSRAVINTNFSNLNNGKIEVSTTSIGNIIALPNLATIGTIISGTWQGSTIQASYGGTGTTTPTLDQIMFGNGSSGFKVIGFGSSGQFLTSNGVGLAPSWQTAAIDQTANYTWTGRHEFQNSTTTFTNTNAKLFIGTSTPPLFIRGIVNALDAYFAGGLGIGVATTTQPGTLVVSGLASTTALTVSGPCAGCPTTYTASSTVYGVSSGTITYTGSIPTWANLGIGEFAIDGGNLLYGAVILTRTGLTSHRVGVNSGGLTNYLLTWSGNNFSVQEQNDAGTNSISGTMYWYK